MAPQLQGLQVNRVMDCCELGSGSRDVAKSARGLDLTSERRFLAGRRAELVLRTGNRLSRAPFSLDLCLLSSMHYFLPFYYKYNQVPSFNALSFMFSSPGVTILDNQQIFGK